MICLGIESTAHTFGIGIMNDRKKVLANVISAFKTTEGGLIPAEVADHHVEYCAEVLHAALDHAKICMGDIDLISYSQSPGIGHCLRVGAMAARTLAIKHKKPVIGVNHCIAHLEIGNALTASQDPVLLYVSGANTQVIAYDGGKYRIFGETLDMGVGNFLDQFARTLGLGFPGGPQIAEHARRGKQYVDLPYCVKGMDISLGGILTNLKQKLKKIEKKEVSYSTDDLCFSTQETVFAMLVEVAERAMAHCGKKELLLGGGVACNHRLQEMCRMMCRERKARCYVLPNEFNVDNGAMIAWLGILMYQSGMRLKVKDARINPYLRTDDVEVRWR